MRYFALTMVFILLQACGESRTVQSRQEAISTESGVVLGLIPGFDGSTFLYLRCEDSKGYAQTRDFYKEKYRVAYTVKKFALTQNCQLPIDVELYKENLEEARQFIRNDIIKNSKQPNMLLQLLSQFVPSFSSKLEQEQLVKQDWLEIMALSLNELELDRTTEVSAYVFIKLENYFSYVLNRTLAVDEKALEMFGMKSIAYEMALTALLQSRCLHYQGIKPANLSCFKLAEDMVAELNFNLMGEASAGKAFISFTKELQQLVMEPALGSYLNALLKELQISQQRSSLGQFNVYRWSKTYLSNDQQALKYMATLFQDYVLLAQLHYLKMASFPKSQRARVMNNIELVEKILAIATQQPRIMGFDQIEDVDRHGDRGYHFFVPAYLASKLRQRGYSEKQAAAMPFVFNTIYEYARDINVPVMEMAVSVTWSLNRPGRWLNIPEDVWKKFTSLFKAIDDPVSLRQWQDLGTLEDIYYGYAGASYGAKFPAMRFLNYAQFHLQFTPAPKNFIGNNFF